MKRRLIALLAVVGLSAGLLMGCTPQPQNKGGDVAGLQGSWVLASWSDALALPSAPITLVISGSGVSGNGGCNAYTSDFTASADGAFLPGGVAVTAMLCTDDAVNQAEAKYLQLFSAVDSWRMDGASLVLFSKTGDQTLTYSRGA